MNKTISINLGKVFFHIDEEAYDILKIYLASVRQSLEGEEGRDEILSDIESRIGELFTERMESERHVLSVSEVKEIIAIMGEPEDYRVDDDSSHIHAEEEKTKKQYFRDEDASYIGGVCAGIAHYFSVDPIWVRLIYVLLTIFSQGFFLILYIVLWIVIPSAKTTADKLAMKGEPVTLSTIEKKVKEEFSRASKILGDVKLEGLQNSTRNVVQNIFNMIGLIIRYTARAFIKFLGFIIVITAGFALLGLLLSVVTMGTISLFGVSDSFYNIPGYTSISNEVPLWLMKVLIFFIAGIPLFIIFGIGERLINSKVKVMRTPVFIAIIALWILSVGVFAYVGMKDNFENRHMGEMVSVIDIPLEQGDSVSMRMVQNLMYNEYPVQKTRAELKFDEHGEKFTYGSNVKISFAHAKDNNGKIRIRKQAYAGDIIRAREIANTIEYDITIIEGKEIAIPAYYTSIPKHADRSMEVNVIIYLPNNTFFKTDINMSDFMHTPSKEALVVQRGSEHWQMIQSGKAVRANADEASDQIDSVKGQSSELM